MNQELWNQLQTASFAGATAFGVSFTLTPLVRGVAVRMGWVTRPTHGRWGRRAAARLGGVAMFGGFLGALLVWAQRAPVSPGLLAGMSLVFVLGLIDDLRRLTPYTKLIVQLMISCVVVISGIRIELIHWPWLSIPLSVLWFVLIMNAFNLLDNMDGLAAGVGAIAAGFCLVHALLAHHWAMAVLAAIVSGTCLGFLRYNFPPAKIFMGDSGSHLIGLSLAALALMGSWRQSTHLLSTLVVPTLVLAVPIFDTLFVTVQRLMHRQPPFAGGTDHVSHRLAILGLSTRQTVVALYGLSVCVGLLSVASVGVRPLTMISVGLFTVIILALVGRYLGRVNVYRLEPHGSSVRMEDAQQGMTLIETMLLHKRRLFEVLVDFGLVTGAYVCAHLLRFEGALSGDVQYLVIQSLPVVLGAKLSCFALCGLYRGVWRYIGLYDVLAVFKATTLGTMLSALALLYLWRFEGYSRSMLIIDWMLTFLAVGGSRVIERLLDEWIDGVSIRGEPLVIVGAGDTGARVLRLLREEGRPARLVVGFLDDDIRKHGDRIHGVRVLGGRGRLAELIAGAGVREVLIAMSDPPGEILQYIRQCCEPQGVTWKVVTAGVTNAT